MLKCPKPADSQSQNGTQFENWKIKLAPFNYLKDPGPHSQIFREYSQKSFLNERKSSAEWGVDGHFAGRKTPNKLTLKISTVLSFGHYQIPQYGSAESNHKYLQYITCRYVDILFRTGEQSNAQERKKKCCKPGKKKWEAAQLWVFRKTTAIQQLSNNLLPALLIIHAPCPFMGRKLSGSAEVERGRGRGRASLMALSQ